MKTKNTPQSKELKIAALKNGTVIDHIPPKVTFKIIELLGLDQLNTLVSAAMNLESKRTDKKGLVKIGDKFLSEEEVNKIAILAPKATLSIIKNYEVVQKKKLMIPNNIERIIKCSNPVCITNHTDMTTKFEVITKEPLKVRCHYCERAMKEEDIVVI